MAKRHWIAGVLVVSLALNLLGVGALAARWAMGSPPGPMAWAMRDMDSATRERVGEALRGRMKEVAPVRQEFRQSQVELKRVVSSDPLDEVALSQALITLRDVSQRYQLQLHTIALDILPQLSSKQRRRAVHALLQAGPERFGRHDRKRNHPEGERPRPPQSSEQGPDDRPPTKHGA
jgi:uncharacterized membrane protein